MPQLYVIAGCNGAGKTTASLTVLPEMLNCHEFVNADMIAAGLSPFNPEGVALEAGRIMLMRIKELMYSGRDFAFETTLSTRSYVSFLKEAKEKEYTVTLLFFWLPSPEQAIMRVAERVQHGGHFIEDDVVRRRYKRGIENFFTLYKDIPDSWLFFNNGLNPPELLAQKKVELADMVFNAELWKQIQP